MPSLHAGWDLVIGSSIATAAGTVAVRVVGCVVPVLMAFAMVVTANGIITNEPEIIHEVRRRSG